MARLIANVWAGGAWYGPAYPDAGDPPAGSVASRTAFGEAPQNPLVVPEPAPSEVGSDAAGEGPPARQGPGSSRAKWAAYAHAHDVTVTDDATRDDIIAACDAVRVPTG